MWSDNNSKKPFRKSIKHDVHANVPIMRSAPGYSLFSTFCQHTEAATRDDQQLTVCYASAADSTTFTEHPFQQPSHEPVQMFKVVNDSEGEQLPTEGTLPLEDSKELRDTPVLIDFHDDEYHKEAAPAPQEGNVDNPTAELFAWHY